MSAGVCRRFPCDQAYKRGAHVPDKDGDVLHSVGWGGDMDMGRDDLRYMWQVRTIAWGDDGDWYVQVIIGDESFQFWKVDDARRMIDGLVSATLCAAQARVDEADRREVEA
jgi:hypothetical protein